MNKLFFVVLFLLNLSVFAESKTLQEMDQEIQSLVELQKKHETKAAKHRALAFEWQFRPDQASEARREQVLSDQELDRAKSIRLKIQELQRKKESLRVDLNPK